MHEVYYRLKVIDIDGRFTYSNFIVLTLDNKMNVLLYPNPMRNNATLRIMVNETNDLQVRILRKEQWNIGAGNNSLPVNESKLAGGLYFLELKGKTLNRRIQFVKL